jgi:septum formation protein
VIPAALGLGSLVLASRSPQRRAILTQLGIGFEVREPAYVERDPAHADPVAIARCHARGKAASVVEAAAGRPVLGVDTVVDVDGVYSLAAK